MPTNEFLAISSVFLSAITVLIYSFILLSTYRWKTYQRSKEFSLFYIRFAIDMIYSVVCASTICAMVFADTTISGLFQGERYIWFFITWPFINIGTFRDLLVFSITLDRICAVYMPILYHLHRKSISNLIVLSGIFCYVTIENGVLFCICKFYTDTDEVGQCYKNYWLGYGQLIYIFIFLSSLILAAKLFFEMISKSIRSEDFTKASRLALLDSLLIFCFGLLPPFVLCHADFLEHERTGPVIGNGKMMGFLVEAIVVWSILSKKNRKISMVSSSIVVNLDSHV